MKDNVDKEQEQGQDVPEGDIDEEKETVGMTEMEKRLFRIRLKINQARKANRKETVAEFNRLKDPKYEAKQRYQERQLEEQKEEMKRRSDESLNEKTSNSVKSLSKAKKEYDELMSVTAAMAEEKKEKLERKAKSAATFGWQAFTAEADYRAYEKQLTKLPSSRPTTATVTSQIVDTSAIDDPSLLDYGKTGKASKEGIDRMSHHIEERQAARLKSSRRRMHMESADVDSINAKNEFFNKKIKRAFDKYTVEIRQNLERGTAV